MIRSLTLAAAAFVLATGLAIAEPAVQVRYLDGVPEVSIAGNYPRTHYTILRGAAANGPFAAMTDLEILCLGSCFGIDYEARPGETYWYRFDLVLEDGSRRSFGPYAVMISATLARGSGALVFPNPMSSSGRIELFLSGAPNDPALEASALLFDLQGRRVRTFWSGPLRRGLTAVSWNGRDDAGRALGSGAYFLRFSSPLGTRITRLVRVQ